MKITLLLILSCFLLIGGCDSTQKSAQPAAQSEPVIVIEASPEPLKEVLPEEKTDAHKNNRKSNGTAERKAAPGQTHSPSLAGAGLRAVLRRILDPRAKKARAGKKSDTPVVGG